MSTVLAIYDSRVQVDGSKQFDTVTLSGEFDVTKTATDAALALGTINTLRLASASSTIASGTFARSKAWHIVAGEGASADTLDSVTGGAAGDILVLSSAADANDITVKHATGASKFQLAGGADCVLGITQDRVVLMHDGTNWNELCRALNHA